MIVREPGHRNGENWSRLVVYFMIDGNTDYYLCYPHPKLFKMFESNLVSLLSEIFPDDPIRNLKTMLHFVNDVVVGVQVRS